MNKHHRIISHVGANNWEVGARCERCRIRSVRFNGDYCPTCREVVKANNIIGWLFLIALVSAVLIMALSSAYATHYQINNMRTNNGKIL